MSRSLAITEESFTLSTFAKLRKATINTVMSVHPHGTTRFPMHWYLWNLIYENFSKSGEKIQVSLKSDKNYRYFTWRPICILIISPSVLLIMRNAPNKPCRDTPNKLSFENRAVCEIIWKNTVVPQSSQMTIFRTRIACLITKATKTHSEYVILAAFLQQQWLHKRTSILRYKYAACLVTIFRLEYRLGILGLSVTTYSNFLSSYLLLQLLFGDTILVSNCHPFFN